MKRIFVLLSLLILAAASALPAQSPSSPAANPTAAQTAQKKAAAKKAAQKKKKAEVHLKPFSSIAFGGGMSLLGVNMQASTNLNRYMNLRVTGNYFNYTATNININGGSNGSGSTTGVDVSGKANFATAGASLDFYPFPRHGLRLSPGVLFYNQNGITANATASSGTSFTLSGTKYYSDNADPLTLAASVGFNATNPAFTLTTGWGNMIPRRGGHWSFPSEFGVAFTGAPALNMTLGGSACTNQADAANNGSSCVNMATNSIAQTNLANQLSIWKNDVNPYKVYPIFSFGISYSFNVRPPQ